MKQVVAKAQISVSKVYFMLDSDNRSLWDQQESLLSIMCQTLGKLSSLILLMTLQGNIDLFGMSTWSSMDIKIIKKGASERIWNLRCLPCILPTPIPSAALQWSWVWIPEYRVRNKPWLFLGMTVIQEYCWMSLPSPKQITKQARVLKIYSEVGFGYVYSVNNDTKETNLKTKSIYMFSDS